MPSFFARLRRSLPRLIAFLIIVLVLFWGIDVTRHGLAAAQIVRSRLGWARQLNDGAAIKLPSTAEMADLDHDLGSLDVHLRALRRDVRPVLAIMDKADKLPMVGPDVQAAPHLLDAGIELLEGARASLKPGVALLQAASNPASAGSSSLAESVVASLVSAGPDLQPIRPHVTAAQAAIDRIHGVRFGTPLGRYVEQMRTYLPLLETAIRAAPLAPTALGSDGARSYLLLAQNSDELRATGGFISSVGVLTVDKGKVSQLSLRDSYSVDDLTVDHPVPPEPLIRYMNIGVLLLRDVNWWPDFPTTARAAMAMWQGDQRQTLDGAIALDLEGMRLLVEGLGPLSIEGETQPVAAASLIPLLREKWGVVPQDATAKGQWWVGRKDVVAAVAQAALAKLQGGMKTQDIARLAQALSAAVEGKHLMVYASDPGLRSVLAGASADGAVLPTGGDALFVVDTNMGFNKVNPRIGQRIDYAVDLSTTGRSQAHVTLTYTNTAAIRLPECVHGPFYGLVYDDMMERCYWDYVRVYTPLGSTPIVGAQSPDLDLSIEGDRQVLANLFVVAPGEAHTQVIDYLLPSGIVQSSGQARRYTLLVQKQGGTGDLPLRLTVSPPAGYHVTWANVPATPSSANRYVIDAVLSRDLRFEVTYAH